MLLTTLGSRSGKPRTIPITYITSDGGYVLTASNGGSDKNPSWFTNIQKNPEVIISIRDKKLNALGATVDKTTKDRLWAQLISSEPWYANYQTRTTREIPMVMLRARDISS